MPPLNIQQQFFEKLKSITPHEQLAVNVSEVLEISTSEAYKKISGKSLLNIRQIEQLCNKFKVSFEYNPMQSSNKVLFSYSDLTSGKGDIENYLDNLYNSLTYINSAPDCFITCSTDDIPVFHLFQYPELSAFKLFFWKNRIQQRTKRTELFSLNSINKKLVNKCFRLHNEYMKIPATEIWTKGSLLNTLYQIEYAIDARLIKDKSIILQLCDQLEFTIREVAEYAMIEEKNNIDNKPIKFNWYFCENIGTTTYLANVSNGLVCYQRFNTFNNLQTDDKAYCVEINLWMQSLIKESICVSGQGEKQRNNYIEETIKNINQLKNHF
ncbi:MAG TPA: helix-turn-helix domain-containing protein [Chitinophagaceae bacterium]